MLKMQKELSSEINKIKKWIKKEKVIDIILFGSVSRGKDKPNDTDLCVIIKDEDEKKSLDLVDSLGKLTDNPQFKFHINILTEKDVISGNTLTNTLLSEGLSIKKNKDFSSIFGFESKILFVYSLKDFSPSKRVKFHYLLRGRYGSKGVLKEVNGEFLGTGSIIVPTNKGDYLKEVFDKWGVDYKIKRILYS